MQKQYLSKDKSMPSGGVNTSSVVWSDNPNLVKKIEIVGNYPDQKLKVRISAGEKGNAVVAFHKGENGVFGTSQPDKILWSWHLWCPETDPNAEENQITYTTESTENGGIIPTTNAQIINPSKGGTPLTTTFMDKNLGALNALPSVMKTGSTKEEYDSKMLVQNSGGLHYQWGRKDPFPTFHNPGGNQKLAGLNNNILADATFNIYRQIGLDSSNQIIYDTTNPVTDLQFSSTDATEGYSREWNVYRQMSGISDDDTKTEKVRKVIKYATENPLSYLYQERTGNESDIEGSGTLASKTIEVKDWLSDENGQAQDRWGHAEAKSVYDPCPAGWRVPDTANANLFAAGNNGSYAKGSSPWFYNGYNTSSSFKDYGVVQSTVANLTGAAVNNPVGSREYPGYVLSMTAQDSMPSSRSGIVFNFPDSNFNIGNIPMTGIRGILGGNDWKNLKSDYPNADNYRYQTGLWTSSPADFYTGYAIGLNLSSVSGYGGKLAVGTGFYPQAAMGVRCVKDTERYMGDLPYTYSDSHTHLSTALDKLKNNTSPLTVYPNPAKDYIHIVSPDKVLNDSDYDIYNAAGDLVASGKIFKDSVDVMTLPKGFYILKIKNTNQAVKFLKR